MIAETMNHPREIHTGDRIASWNTPQHVQTVSAVRECAGECKGCFAPTIHVDTDSGEVRFPATGWSRMPWSKIRKGR